MGKFLLPRSDDKNLGCTSKALLTYTVIPSLFNYFDLPSYSSELRKRYTKAAVDVSRDTGRREFWELFCLVGGEK